MGRCHARIGFHQRGILFFLPCCHQGPKHWATGSISARLLQNCMSGHLEDAGARHPAHPGHPALVWHCAASLCPAHEERESSLLLLLREQFPVLLWRPPPVQQKLSAGKFYCFNFFFNGTIFPILLPAKPADLVILGLKCAGLTGRWQSSYKCYKTLQQPLTSLVLPRPEVSARSLC